MTTHAVVIGNLTADPEARISQAGKPWTTVRVASTTREKDRQTGDWKDSDPLFVSIPVFGDLADHVVQSLAKGMRVIAYGKLKNRSYTDSQGNERIATELVECESIGPDLRWATAQVSRAQRSQAGAGAPQAQGQAQWGQPAQNQPQTGGQGFGGNFEDEQPF